MSAASTTATTSPPARRRPNQDTQRALITTASSIGAVLLSFAISGALLLVTGENPLDAFSQFFDTATDGNKLLEALQRATPLAMSAVAVAIGFKMGLFNIGVEGQYLFGAFVAAVVGAELDLPPLLHVPAILLVAMVAGAAWASIAAVLKVTRNVNEVISTIMLNYIALSVIQWLFDEYFRDDRPGGLNVKTKPIPASGLMPDLVDNRLSGMFLIAIAVLIGYWLLVFKSRFGFRLRASGLNPVAARTSGIPSKRMIIVAMLISGGVAGLLAMPAILGEIGAYGQGVPDALGFNGIAVALLGRNHPLGIGAAAFLFGLLNAASTSLQLQGIPSSIVAVIQAITVLTVVIVNEAVTRKVNRRTADRTAREIHSETGPIPAGATA